MRAQEIEHLLTSAPDRPLDGLCEDIWRGVADAAVEGRDFRTLAMAQAAVGLAVVLGGAVWGGALASEAMARGPTLGVFSPQMALAPSSRLNGRDL